VSEKRYQIVVREQIEDLEERVNELWDEGWRPTGGMTFATVRTLDDFDDEYYEGGTVYAQTMVLPQKRCADACIFDEEVNLMFAGSAT